MILLFCRLSVFFSQKTLKLTMNTSSGSLRLLYPLASAHNKGLDEWKTMCSQCWSFGPYFYHEECLSLKFDH